jgi:Tol biopolymer transport system component
MNRSNDPDVLIHALLEDGPTRLSDRALASTLGEVHRTRQRTVLGPWRTLPMSRTAIAAAAVIAVLAVGGLALYMNRASSGPSVGSPAASGAVASPGPASPSTRPSLSPSALVAMPVGVQASGTIVFGTHDPTTDATTLHAVTPDGQRTLPLLSSDACCLAMSPNGQSFAYAVDLHGRLTPGFASLVDLSLDEWPWSWTGSGPGGTIDTSQLNLAPGAVSESGATVAFEGWDDQRSSRNGIYVSFDNGGGLAIGELKRLTTTPGSFHDVPIGFSPDGSRLLFIRDQDPGDGVNGDLFVIDAAGAHLRKLNPASTRVPVSDPFGPGASWSPDGTQVAFSAFDATLTDGTSSVYVVPVAGGTARAITSPGSWTTSARWSPDGQWIAFDRGMPGGQHDVFLIHPDGTGEKDITTALDVGVCCGQWSPDGHWLVVQGSLTGRDDQSDLFIISAVDSAYARLTEESGGYRNWVSWVSATTASMPASPNP